MDSKTLKTKHPLWHANISNWEFYIRSYLGGNDYKNGYYLHRYIFVLRFNKLIGIRPPLL